MKKTTKSPISFDLQPNGLYKNNENGRELTSEQIKELPDCCILEIFDKPTKPPVSYKLYQCSKTQFRKQLRQKEKTICVTLDNSYSTKPFRNTQDGRLYSFDDLMKLKLETQNTIVCMNPETKQKYIECLEQWC